MGKAEELTTEEVALVEEMSGMPSVDLIMLAKDARDADNGRAIRLVNAAIELRVKKAHDWIARRRF